MPDSGRWLGWGGLEEATLAISVRTLESSDSMKVLAIYSEAIKGPDATFETNVPTWSEWHKAHLPNHRLAAVDDAKKILGWTALSRFSERREYAGVVESHTYVRGDARRTGVGTALLTSLLAATEAQGLWTVQALVFPENAGGLRLHEKVGFEVVGTRRRIGRHRGRWRDMILLERRSPAVN
jgi:L-amino acid N-acyltransferase YncA